MTIINNPNLQQATAQTSDVKYLTQKSLFQDQLYQVLKILTDKQMIASSSASETIIAAYTKLEKNPDYRIVDSIYDIEQHKVVKATIEPMNFALSHIAIMTEKNEIYFFLDNNKIIFVYELTNNFQPMEVFFFLSSIMSDPNYYNMDLITLLDPDQNAIEEIIGVPLIS